MQASESGELEDKWLTVGHMPIELSRQIYFSLKCGGSVQATVLDIALHRSLVTLKGLEIHLNTRFSISVDKITILERLQKHVLESYLSASAKEEVDIRVDPVQEKADTRLTKVSLI